MLILLPPSETKAPGGDGPPLDLDVLSWPDLTRTRRDVIAALSALADDVPASLSVLGLSERQVEEARRNTELWDAPTRPALERYTGVLYDALDIGSLTPAERARADQRIAVASALFGLVRGPDPIPPYRLSGGHALPGLGPLRRLWPPVLEPVLHAVDDLIVDLRSGAYVALAKVPGAVTVRVLSEDRNGNRKVVSHYNKAHKGKLAGALVRSSTEPSNVDDVFQVAKEAGMRAEWEGARGLCVVVDA